MKLLFMTDCFPAALAFVSGDSCEAHILEAREHDELVVEGFFDAPTDDDWSDETDYSTGDESDGDAGAQHAERADAAPAVPAADLAVDVGLTEPDHFEAVTVDKAPVEGLDEKEGNGKRYAQMNTLFNRGTGGETSVRKVVW